MNNQICRTCRYYDAQDKACYLKGYRQGFKPTDGCDRWVYNTDRFADIVNAHVRHACKKHPGFVRTVCPVNTSYMRFSKHADLYREMLGQDSCLAYALLSEVYEFLAEVARGDANRAEQEAADVMAVIIRALAGHIKEK